MPVSGSVSDQRMADRGLLSAFRMPPTNSLTPTLTRPATRGHFGWTGVFDGLDLGSKTRLTPMAPHPVPLPARTANAGARRFGRCAAGGASQFPCSHWMG